MNLYLLTQTKYDGYETYSDAVVAAESDGAAQFVHPNASVRWTDLGWVYRSEQGREWPHNNDDWPEQPADVNVKLIGTAVDGIGRGVICASFHAG